MFSPENIHANNIMQTKQAVLLNMQQQLIYGEAMNLKKKKTGTWRGGGQGEGMQRVKCYNCDCKIKKINKQEI